MGARLCTGIELARDVARGTGCKMDNKMVWASGGNVAGGSSKATVVSITISPTSTFPVRCCSDDSDGQAPPLDVELSSHLYTLLGPGNCRTAGGKKIAGSAPARPPATLEACAAACKGSNASLTGDDKHCSGFEFKPRSNQPCKLFSDPISHARGANAGKTTAQCYAAVENHFCGLAGSGSDCDDSNAGTDNDKCGARAICAGSATMTRPRP